LWKILDTVGRRLDTWLGTMSVVQSFAAVDKSPTPWSRCEFGPATGYCGTVLSTLIKEVTPAHSLEMALHLVGERLMVSTVFIDDELRLTMSDR
jgi:hypothetical protein